MNADAIKTGEYNEGGWFVSLPIEYQVPDRIVSMYDLMLEVNHRNHIQCKTEEQAIEIKEAIEEDL